MFIIYNFSFFMLIVKCYRSEYANMHNISWYIIIRLSEKSFVLFIQYLPDEGLFLLDWCQF